MRIAVVGTRGIPGVPGGVERHCEELYPRLAARGHDVVVFARDGYVSQSDAWRGVEVRTLPAPVSRSTETIVHTARAIQEARRWRPDVLHIHSIGPAGLIDQARLLGMRTCLTVHAFDYLQEKWGRLARSYLRWGESRGVRSASVVIAVAEWMAEELRVRFGREIQHVPNGPLGLRRREPGDLLKTLGVQPGEYLLSVGRLIPDKRIEDLMAASQLGDVLPVVVVGDASHTGPYAQRLRAQAPESVVFAGSRDREELAELYSNAAVYVHPSAVEGLPLSLIEAMSLGVPCVSAAIHGSREVLGGLGRLVPVGDRTGLREEIDACLRLTAEERRSLASKLSARVHGVYDWDLIAHATERVLEEVADRRRGDRRGRRD